MTTVIAVQKKGKVLLGHDSQATYPHNGEKIHLRDGKIVKNGPYLFGNSGRGDFKDILADAKFPEPTGDTRQFVRKVLAPILSKLELDEYGQHTNQLIVVVNAEAFVYGGGHVDFATVEGIYSVGSGGVYAENYLHGLRRSIRASDVKRALEVAAARDSYTSGPFVVKEVK